MNLPLDPRYAALGNNGAPFHRIIPTTPLPEPRLLHYSVALAEELGISDFAPDNNLNPLVEILAGNQPWPGYASRASVYSGHQFGSFAGQLGDGRALIIAEILDKNGQHRELQLKGAGQTPYSRRADGRAVLRSSIREYLCSEAMYALGVPTTRCLSIVGSPQPVWRETMETAAVVCRVAPSFIRFGHFEHFYYQEQHEYIAPLADYVIANHFPHLLEKHADAGERYVAWLTEVVERTAELMAQWQTLGFCHGVMNTDNMSILGLTIDYGPFGFMDAFDPGYVCNHSDDTGRYAYNQQPSIGDWNCLCLLQACLPLLPGTPPEAVTLAKDIYQRYEPAYTKAAQQRWADKLGFLTLNPTHFELVNRLLDLMHRGHSDFTRSFRNLSKIRTDSDEPAHGVRDEYLDMATFDAWVKDYRSLLRAEGNTDDAARAERMNRVNPKYVLRNHLAQAAIAQAEQGDMAELHRLAELLTHPYDEQPEMEAYATEPPADARHICVSCSS